MHSWSTLRQQFSDALRQRREVEFASAYGRVLELEAERLDSAADFSDLLSLCLMRVGFSPAPGSTQPPLHIVLEGGWSWELAHPGEGLEIKRRRLESLLPGVNRAVQRWQELPGHKITPVADGEQIDQSLSHEN